MGVEQITPGKIIGLVITLGGVSLVSVLVDPYLLSPHSWRLVFKTMALVATERSLETLLLSLQLRRMDSTPPPSNLRSSPPVFFLFLCSLSANQIPEDDGISMQLLFGYVGLVTSVSLSPILFILVRHLLSSPSHHAISSLSLLGPHASGQSSRDDGEDLRIPSARKHLQQCHLRLSLGKVQQSFV
jgi:hypothetical protein